MSAGLGALRAQEARPAWYQALAKYQQPNLRKAVWQLTSTLVPYVALWAGMYWIMRLGYPYWITLALSVVGGGLLIRIFILFHDCCHGSFFASRRANRIWGYVCGILTFTPYEEWRHTHAIHHATASDLDRRGTGDVWTMTVDEYQAAPRLQRLAYRLFRHPLVLFGLGPVGVFLLAHRLPRRGSRKYERYSVWFTNLALLAIILLASLTIGLGTYVAIQLPILAIGGAAGIWLFYVQHQFEGVYWARYGEWSPTKAALQGSSYYKLPKVLQWFTGSIGLHHIHHARPRIPNYSLQRCYEEVPELQLVESLALRTSLRSLQLRLWDERQQKLVSFRSLRRAR
jgi:omega-6 fatty acid desaturase (delta-12 desaturase)